MKLAIQGAGNWGRNWVRVYNELIGPENVIVVDPNVADGDFPENLVTDEVPYGDISAVVIATPTEDHFKHAWSALGDLHECDIMVEKPMALSAKDARNLVFVARGWNSVLMTNHLMLVHPAYVKMKQMIKDGAIGEIDEINSWRYGATPRESGIVWNLAPHDLSMCIDLLGGSPQEVAGYTGIRTTFVKLNWDNNIVAVFRYQQNSFMSRRYRVFEVHGDKGTISLKDGILYKKTVDVAATWNEIEVNDTEPLKLMAQAFLNSIKQGKATVASGERALPVIETIERWHECQS